MMTIKRADPVDVQEQGPLVHRIAWWIENTFRRVFKLAFNAIKDSFQDLLAFAIEQFMDVIEGGLRIELGPLLDEMETYDDLPIWMQQTITNAREGEHAAAVLLLAPMIMALVQVLSSGMQEAIGPVVTHRLNAILRAQLVDPYTAVGMWRRELINEEELLRLTRAGGWADWLTEYVKSLSGALYDQGELLPAFWRGEISDATLHDQLRKRGYSDEHIALWKSLSQRIPSPSDLISIAVREGFDDAVARRFGYDEAFPSEAAQAAEKGGLGTEWFQKMWRAHWRLPSVTQGFDMFHRGIMSREDLDLLLRASDIPSFWRERLVQLSYNVITRVDVRRMYALGVFTEQEVYDTYLDRGYSPTDAQSMTEWTIKEYAEQDRVLTKTDVLRMYRSSVLNEDEASAYLDAIGYAGPEIGMLLAREDLLKIEAYEKEVVENVKVGYIQHIYDRTDVWQELGKLDPPSGFIQDQLALWDIERARRVIRPTVTQLRDFWLTEIITDEELEEEMIGRGYTTEYIKWYKQLWALEG